MTRTAFLLLGLALALASPAAAASSFGGTTGGSTANGASNTSGSSSGDDKVVADARDDAATFVATDGRIRGARLEAALRLLRDRDAGAREADDLQLARAILAR